jgi:hypothetical protein
VDNDGDALIVGSLYFDSTAGAMKVYSANGWTNAGSSVNGTTNRYSYTATAGQTVFAATYDAGYVDVFLNGVKQLVGTDVTATSGTSVVFASGTTVNDIVEIVGYGTFVLADHLTETQSDAKYVEVAGDTMTGGLTIQPASVGSFTPNAAADDLVVENNGNTGITIVSPDANYSGLIFASATDPTGSIIEFNYNNATLDLGTATSGGVLRLRSGNFVEAAQFDASGNFLHDTTTYTGSNSPQNSSLAADAGTVIEAGGTVQIGRYQNSPLRLNRMGNEGAIAEFKVGGSTIGTIGSENSHFIMGSGDTGIKFHSGVDAIIPHDTDGSTNRDTAIDLGFSSGGRFRDLHLARRLHTAFVNADDNTSTGTYFTGGSNNRRQLQFSSFDTASLDAGHEIKASSTSGRILLTTYNTTHLTLDAVSNTSVFNEGGADQDFRVESDGEANMFFIDANENKVFIGGNLSNYDANRLVVRGPSVVPGGTNGNVGIYSTDNHQADVGGSLTFGGRYSTGGTYYMFGGIQAVKRTATSGDASGKMKLYYVNNSNSTIPYHIASQDGIQFNPDGNDVDFRVESDNNANMIVVNADTDSVGIGVDPASKGSVLVTEGGSSLHGAEIATDAESYALSSSSKVQYSPSGTTMRVYNRSTSTAGSGSLIDFLAYGGSSGTAAQNVFLGAVGTSSGSSNTANLVFGRRTGTTAWGEMARFDPNGTFIHGNNAHSWTSNSTALFHSGGIGVTSNSDWSLQLAGSTTQRIRFFTSNGGSGATVGSVSVSASSTSYNTSSDYRLKENVVDLTGATERVKQLEPKRFNFIADADTVVDGFLAHEAQAVVPEAVTGTHNEVDDDGTPVYQGIDQAKLVPLLTAALQEAITKIEDLEARIATLEG